MDPLLVGILVAIVSYFVLNSIQKKKKMQKAVEIGANIYDQIMKGGIRSTSTLPPADVYGCAVGAFAANPGIPSTFTSKGEPLAKYKFRQMVHDFLPAKYQNDRVYFNCANVEATIFWISYMEKFFLHSFSRVYQPNTEWFEKFHEYYWKFSIYNMMTEMRKPDVPMFLAKIQDASNADVFLSDDAIYAFIVRGARLPEGTSGSDGSVFNGYALGENSAKVRSILNRNVTQVFRNSAEQQAKNLVSLFVPEKASESFDLDDDDRKLPEIVNQCWTTVPNDVSIPVRE